MKTHKLPPTPVDIPPPPRKPVWGGPIEEGVSQTMLSRYLSDRERFRISYCEGLQPAPMFNPRLEFGNMWHEAEEAFAEHGDKLNPNRTTAYETIWQRRVYDYGNKLGELYPMQKDQIIHWLQVTIALFPAYINYWRKHPDMEARKPLLQEEKFTVPYKLPSGRIVKLRGKWDSVDLITKGENAGIWLQENKTKSSIDKGKIERQLRFDLQTMLYLIALDAYTYTKECGVPLGTAAASCPIRGIRYNVIRRSSHKSAESMMKKVGEDLTTGRDAEWFARWDVPVAAEDIQRFKNWTLDPLLECVCDDYEWWSWCMVEHDGRKIIGRSPFDQKHRGEIFTQHRQRHYVMPYMGYNPLSDGGESDVDNYLFTGSEVGLQRITNCFPEL